MEFVCPQCKGELVGEYECLACGRNYPVIAGIPDFRIFPDPYIPIDDDRRKGAHLAEMGRTRSFQQMLQYYYSITPEDPEDLAKFWIAHALAETEIAARILGERHGESLLDVGCSTGGLLAAANPRFRNVCGVDVAFRWLVIGQVRMRELGIRAELVCANAEALPFRTGSFDLITAIDVLEHLRDPGQAAKEFRLAARELLCTTNNRFAPLPDPQVRLWGVGYLPRRLQATYVAKRRRDLHRYNVSMLGAGELKKMLRTAGYRSVHVDAAPLYAPHQPQLQRALGLYNSALPIIGPLAKLIGPKIQATAEC